MISFWVTSEGLKLFPRAVAILAREHVDYVIAVTSKSTSIQGRSLTRTANHVTQASFRT